MKIIFAGTPLNAGLALRLLAKKHEVALVITREDSFVGRSRQLQPSEVAKVAMELGLPVHKVNKFDDETLKAISLADAQFAIVIAFGALIPKTALDLLPWWNIHFSLLPKWRGASPLQQSIIHADGEGVTLFQIDTGLDTGPLLSQKALAIAGDETYTAALERFTIEGVNLALEALEKLPTPKEQIGTPSYAPKITRADARLLFSESAEILARKIRALNPEPIAWTEYEGLQLRILESWAIGSEDWSQIEGKAPEIGEVIVMNQKAFVCCGEGTRLELLRVQPAGKKPMSAIDWARGLRGDIRLG